MPACEPLDAAVRATAGEYQDPTEVATIGS